MENRVDIFIRDIYNFFKGKEEKYQDSDSSADDDDIVGTENENNESKAEMKTKQQGFK